MKADLTIHVPAWAATALLAALLGAVGWAGRELVLELRTTDERLTRIEAALGLPAWPQEATGRPALPFVPDAQAGGHLEP